MSQSTKKPIKNFDEYDCGNGPRPPVPGEESQMSKMTTEGASHSTSSSNSNRSPDASTARIEKWQESLSGLMTDEEGRKLLYKFVEQEAGESSIHYTRLTFYFVVDGLRNFEQNTDEKIIRKLIKKIYEMIRDKIPISSELQKTISAICKKEMPPDRDIFNDLQKSVAELIDQTTYRSFLQSEMFIQYVNNKEFDSQPPIASVSQPICNTNIASASSSNSSTAAASMTSSTADGATAFTGMTVELSPLLTTPTLQTLHEDTELKLGQQSLARTTTERPMPKLTSELLLATEKRRLEVRPQGALFAYNNAFNVSYNPVSRQDSERQSCSDSERNSKDGKPYMHRKPMQAEGLQKFVNPQSQSVAIKPLQHGIKGTIAMPSMKSRLEQAAQELNTKELVEKLIEVKRDRDRKEKQQEQFSQNLNDKLSQHGMFVWDQEDDQSILDQHVSKVFSSGMSPGTVSPGNLHRSMHDFGTHQHMRPSRSIPEHASAFGTTTKKLSHKWPSTSINHDSGIDSLYSARLPYKSKEMKSTELLCDERMRSKFSKEDLKRTRKQMPIPSSYSHQTNYMPTSSSHHTNSLPRNPDRMHELPSEDYTVAVYTFGDEKIPYRTKIQGKRLTLKHYKDYSPKKGNFRYFFQTYCDSLKQIVQEEVVNDYDPLPLFEGRIMGTIKSDN